MTGYDDLVREEIAATIDRAGFDTLEPNALRVEVTNSFRRKLGECRMRSQSTGDGAHDYDIRIARRLFEGDDEQIWRDTVRHEVAHAFVFAEHGRGVDAHGEEWKAAARRANADPRARYEADAVDIDGDYVLACPNGCYERAYVNRSKRIKQPWRYACPDCETRLSSYDAGVVPTTLEPGTCYVASLLGNRSEETDDRHLSTQPAYLLACPNGCLEWPYQQRSKRIKNPWQYTCPECESALLSCDGDEVPITLEGGVCHVETIPWRNPQIVHACPNGCFSVGYGSHSQETRNPAQYSCGDCGTRTVAYPVDDRPTTLEPGSSYLE